MTDLEVPVDEFFNVEAIIAERLAEMMKVRLSEIFDQIRTVAKAKTSPAPKCPEETPRRYF